MTFKINTVTILEYTLLAVILVFLFTLPLELYLKGMDNLESSSLQVEHILTLIVFSKVLEMRGFFYKVSNTRNISNITSIVKYSFTPLSLSVIYFSAYDHTILMAVSATFMLALYCYDLVVFEHDSQFDVTDYLTFIFAMVSFVYFS